MIRQNYCKEIMDEFYEIVRNALWDIVRCSESRNFLFKYSSGWTFVSVVPCYL